MVGNGRACDACARNCVTFHQEEKDNAPLVTRFWKPVLNKEFSNVLYLPPKFARRMTLMAGQETQIEDSDGQRWSVTLSDVNGSLAFQEGWNKFYIDHGLKEGDLLVFNYVKGSHFVVQVYGLSCCERINFNKEKLRERKRLKRDSQKVSVDKPFLKTDVAEKDVIQNAEVFMDKDPEKAIYNNSNLQNGDNNVLQTNSGKIAQRKYNLRSRNREATVSSSALKVKHAIEKDPAELEEQANCIAGVSSGKEPTAKRKRGRPAKAKHDLPGQEPTSPRQHGHIAGVSSDAGKEPTAKRKRGCPAKAKPGLPGKEPTSPRQCGRPVVKVEPDVVPSNSVMHFSAKVGSQYYLDLPAILPSTPGRRKQKGPGKIVCLKDPMGRIWPLLYRDDLFSVNWRIFCERNRINPGDECRLQAENENNSFLNSPVYRVDVIRSFGG